MSFPLVTSRKLPAADFASERLLAGVCADVSCEVVTSAEVSHADPALERFLTSVYPDVASEFIRPGETAVTSLHRTGIWSLMRRCFAGPIGVFPQSGWFDQLRVVIASVLGLRTAALVGYGFDGGQGDEGRLSSGLQCLKRFLVRSVHGNVLLLAEQIVRDYWQLVACVAVLCVGVRRVLYSVTGAREALRLSCEHIRVGVS